MRRGIRPDAARTLVPGEPQGVAGRSSRTTSHDSTDVEGFGRSVLIGRSAHRLGNTRGRVSRRPLPSKAPVTFVASATSGVRHLVDLGGQGDIGVVRMVVEDVVLDIVVVDEPQFAVGAGVRLLVHGSNLSTRYSSPSSMGGIQSAVIALAPLR